MDNNAPKYRSALSDFSALRRLASMQEILARLTGKSNELLSYDEVAERLKLNARTERGVFDIPINSIVGSVGRYSDFNRSFLPLMSNSREQERWARVKAALDDPDGAGWPAIDVYKVGEVYFVLDGNHRVSVARQEGFTYIQARVIEVKSDVPLTSDIQPDDLIVKAEYADFLSETDFKSLRPEADLSLTVPGQYKILLDHIEVHRYFMGLDFQRDITLPEAITHWYDNIYMSIVAPLRERGLLRWFPGRTETDLYLWISEHRAALESQLGWSVRPEAVMVDLAVHENPQAGNDESETGQWQKNKLVDRYTDRLFQDILVPLSGEPESWQALELALVVAKQESASLHGIHIVTPKVRADSDQEQVIQQRFSQRCVEAGISGSLAVEKGEVSDLVCHLALLNDLVVLNTAHPPAPGLSSLGSGLRSIIWRSSRPVLAIPGQAGSMDKALVAFDGSFKSKQAVFIAAYLAERWKTKLTVLTLSDSPNEHIQDYARDYFSLHEVSAEYIVQNGPTEIIVDVIKERGINLVLMGGYGGNAWQEVIIGSVVNFLLRNVDCPLLICR